MKHFSRIIALAMTVVMFGFFGCSDISSDEKAYVNQGVENADVSTKSITLAAEADNNVIVFANTSGENSRTLLPNAVDADTLHFYLVYQDIINATTASLEEVTFTKEAAETAYTRGTVTKSFSLSNYKFVLYGVTDAIKNKIGSFTTANIAGNASYVGYANADLRYKDVVTFHLKPNSSAAGKGRIEIEINNVDDWQIPVNYVVYAGLYKIEDDYEDTPVYPGTRKEIYTRDTSAEGTLDSVNKSFIMSAASTYDVPAGEYNLIVAYCYQPETAGVTTKVFEYSEKVIVLMNEETIASVNVPDILDKAPDAPTNFTVAYKNPETVETAYYPVQFMWSDNSSTEREFYLQLLEYTEADAYFTMPADDTDWEAILSSGTVKTYTKLVAQNAENYASGSLNKNSTSVTMYLPLGARFIARLSAHNDVGSSDWAYVEWAKVNETYTDAAETDESAPRYAGTAGKPTGTSIVDSTDWTMFPKEVTTINRFRITYDLNGGKFYDNADEPAALTDEPALIHYASQQNKMSSDATPVPTEAASDTANVILSPDGLTKQKWFKDLAGLEETTADAELTLADEGNFWDKWLVDSDTGTAYDQTVKYLSYDTEDTSLDNVGTTNFIGNIKYFPYTVTDDTVAASSALGSQPTKDTWASSAGKYTIPALSATHSTYKEGSAPSETYYEYYRVRQAESKLYTGYKNITLVAHYDTTKTFQVVVDDISIYELLPEWLEIAFAKSGTAVTTAINAAASYATADKVTDVKYVNTVANPAATPSPIEGLSGILEVSLSKVNQITFTVSSSAKIPIISYNEATNTISKADGSYDNVHLKITRIGSGETKVDQDWNANKWTVAFSTWTEGQYLVEFTATTSQMPREIYGCTTVLKITD